MKSGRALGASISLVFVLVAHPDTHAGPVESLDAITRMLVERGLLNPFDAASGVAGSDAFAAPGPSRLSPRLREGASDAVVTALNFLDIPYRYGGKTFDGFDCSGFTRYVFRQVGLPLPASSDEQAHAQGLVSVERDALKPGDLVFFNTQQRTFSHVGIYVGEDRFIHAPRTGSQVRVEDMSKSYWATRFTGGRRYAAWSSPLAAVGN